MAVRGRLDDFANFLVVLLDVFLEVVTERMVVRGNAVIRGSLEDRMVFGLGGDHRRGLDAGGARADLTDPFAGEVDPVTRPLTGVTAPIKTFSTVDLPQPEGPMMETNSPLLRRIETFSIALVDP